jgi:superoxide reductase
MNKTKIYRCSLCGNVIELEKDCGGQLVCCAKPMDLLDAKKSEGSSEKHIPVIERRGLGYMVKIGSVEHPSTQEHYIEWIDLISSDKVYRKFFRPKDKPEFFFDNIEEQKITVRAYCNLHGLWENVVDFTS